MEGYSDSERIWGYPGHIKLFIPILLAKCSIPRLGGESEHYPGSRALKFPCAPCAPELNWALTSQLVSENSLGFSILESKLELLIFLQAVVVPQSWICASFLKK